MALKHDQFLIFHIHGMCQAYGMTPDANDDELRQFISDALAESAQWKRKKSGNKPATPKELQ